MGKPHIHKFFFTEVEGPDCPECEYQAVGAIVTCECGAYLGPSAIERRINALEVAGLGVDRATVKVKVNDPLERKD